MNLGRQRNLAQRGNPRLVKDKEQAVVPIIPNMAFNKEEWKIPTPYGATGWINLLVMFFSSLVFLLAAFRCFFAVNKTDEYKAWVGYWGAENLEIAKTEGRGNDNNYCVAWSKESKDEFFDGAWKFGKAMGVLGAIICIPFILLSFYILVYKVRPVLFTAAIGAYISLAVISLLLLVGLSSDLCDVMSCQMGPGGYFAILSFFLWLGAAFMAFRLRGLSMDDRDDGDYGGESPHDGKPYPDEKRLALPPSENLSQKV